MTILLDSERLDEELEAIVRAGAYPSKNEAVRHALEILLLANPQLRVKTAIELYRDDKVTLARAAEIAGMNIEAFKEALAEAGVERVIDAEPEEVRSGAQAILSQPL
jgi:predicted HTH domain antitoxin